MDRVHMGGPWTPVHVLDTSLRDIYRLHKTSVFTGLAAEEVFFLLFIEIHLQDKVYFCPFRPYPFSYHTFYSFPFP